MSAAVVEARRWAKTYPWLVATCECDFIRTADGWKIKHLVPEIKKSSHIKTYPVM